jgi:hypothetical protein
MPTGILYPYPWLSSLLHLQRRCIPSRHERSLLAKERTIFMNLASKSIIFRRTRFFYMPQIQDMGQIILLSLRWKACCGFGREQTRDLREWVELYLYSPSRPWWPVIGWPLPSYTLVTLPHTVRMQVTDMIWSYHLNFHPMPHGVTVSCEHYTMGIPVCYKTRSIVNVKKVTGAGGGDVSCCTSRPAHPFDVTAKYRQHTEHAHNITTFDMSCDHESHPHCYNTVWWYTVTLQVCTHLSDYWKDNNFWFEDSYLLGYGDSLGE